MQVEEVELLEVSDVALRALLHSVGSYNADAMGEACGSSCGRGANCHSHSEEMEAMLCGAD
jgi:hypothetical protein